MFLNTYDVPGTFARPEQPVEKAHSSPSWGLPSREGDIKRIDQPTHDARVDEPKGKIQQDKRQQKWGGGEANRHGYDLWKKGPLEPAQGEGEPGRGAWMGRVEWAGAGREGPGQGRAGQGSRRTYSASRLWRTCYATFI